MIGCGGSPRKERDFTLHSGERQTGETLGSIRRDHLARYEWAAGFLAGGLAHPESAFGLDIFSATGYGMFLISRNLGCCMFGVEGSSEAVAFANEHFRDDRLFYSHKMFPFSLPVSTFDFVTCFESLEHVDADEAFLRVVTDSIKPGGYLFLSVPNDAMQPLAKNPNEFHFRHYHHDDVVAMLEAKFEMELVTWFGQNMYQFNDGYRVGGLEESEMVLHEKTLGQVLVYLFRKA